MRPDAELTQRGPTDSQPTGKRRLTSREENCSEATVEPVTSQRQFCRFESYLVWPIRRLGFRRVRWWAFRGFVRGCVAEKSPAERPFELASSNQLWVGDCSYARSRGIRDTTLELPEAVDLHDEGAVSQAGGCWRDRIALVGVDQKQLAARAVFPPEAQVAADHVVGRAVLQQRAHEPPGRKAVV